jgi:hypothetical protein
MVNELLVNLVNSVLGAGKRTARGNQILYLSFLPSPQTKT